MIKLSETYRKTKIPYIDFYLDMLLYIVIIRIYLLFKWVVISTVPFQRVVRAAVPVGIRRRPILVIAGCCKLNSYHFPTTIKKVFTML